MNKSKCMSEEKIIKDQLMELLETYYDGSFSRMACDYIYATEMTQEEVKDLLEAMKGVVSSERGKR